MHNQYPWLPTGEFPHRPDEQISLGLAALARSAKKDEHDDIIEMAFGRGKAEVRFVLESVALRRDIARAREFRVLHPAGNRRPELPKPGAHTIRQYALRFRGDPGSAPGTGATR